VGLQKKKKKKKKQKKKEKKKTMGENHEGKALDVTSFFGWGADIRVLLRKCVEFYMRSL
jgi:hypothetical protein